jgi:hypothetical protein
MQKEVIFRARQNVTYDDLNNAQNYAKKSFDDLIADLLVSGKGYAGFMASKATTITLSVAPGRLYDSGQVFASDDTVILPVTSYLPAVAKKVVTLVTYGQTLETDLAPRDFLINVTTRATEPQSVAMTSARKANLSLVAGLEAADPVPPAIQTGYLALANIVLNASGIESIVMKTDTQVPELDAIAAALALINTWQGTTGRIIDGLRTDISNLANRLTLAASQDQLSALASDVSGLKQKVTLDRLYDSLIASDVALIKAEVNAINGTRPDLSSINSLASADDYLDDSLSDTENASYLATIQEGIRFAPSGMGTSVLQVDNPYNGLVSVDANGLMTPTYTSIDGVVVGTQDINAIYSEIPLANYQYATWTMVQNQMARQRLRYGDYFSVCTNSQFWQSGQYNPVTHIFTRNGESFELDAGSYGLVTQHAFLRLRQYWVDSYNEPYWTWDKTTSTIQGAQVAQTFLNVQARYCTGVSLGFTKVGPSGNVHVALCEVNRDGTPDLGSVIAQTTVAQADLKSFPANWTFVQFAPTYLKQGCRYAIVVTTGGAHYVATTSGNDFASGTLFFGTDGAYMTGDLTKDLMFKVHHAKFTNSSITVDLKGLQLSDGISHIDLLAPMVVPPSTTLTFQVLINGQWLSLDYDPSQNNGLSILHGLPPLLPFRVVLTGTKDILPIINLSKSQVLVQRPRTSFTHVSSVRTLPSNLTTNQISVTLDLGNFDTVNHTVSVSILSGSNFATVKGADATVLSTISYRPSADKAYQKTFTFNMPTAVNAYKIQVSGSTTTATNTFHVEKRVDNAIY